MLLFTVSAPRPWENSGLHCYALVFETGSHQATQTSLELASVFQCWESPHLAEKQDAFFGELFSL
jgi:hypothetical protein